MESIYYILLVKYATNNTLLTATKKEQEKEKEKIAKG